MEAVGREAARDIIFCTLRSNVKITRCSIDRNSHRDIIPRSQLPAQYSVTSPVRPHHKPRFPNVPHSHLSPDGGTPPTSDPARLKHTLLTIPTVGNPQTSHCDRTFQSLVTAPQQST